KIEAEQLQLKRYIQQNYTKIREVERELENLNLELKLTAGPKKAALEHLRKKIELSTERIRVAKLKEDQAKKVWEAAAQVVKDEEAVKQKICDDLNQLVQESTNTQLTRLEELKRRLESLNPSRVSSDVSDGKSLQQTNMTAPQPSIHQQSEQTPWACDNPNNVDNNIIESNGQQRFNEAREKKRMLNIGRGKGNNGIVPKGRGSKGPGWTGAGFDMDGGA
ncbi:uncharacterized protein A4U43_C04F22070, partial [Asparagus officinalis]